MEGLLYRWALALQEYDFKIVYRKGTLNANADALSRLGTDTCALMLATSHFSNSQLRQAQQEDGVISKVRNARLQSSVVPQSTAEWSRQPLRRYRQLWSQLTVAEGVLCRQYIPGPTSEQVTVPILPSSLRQQALFCNHNAPTAGVSVDR